MYIHQKFITLCAPSKENNGLLDKLRDNRAYDIESKSVATATEYTSVVTHYQNIARSNLHIVLNEYTPLGKNSAYEILYAMVTKKPIVLSSPAFTHDVGLFEKELILNRLSKLMLCDLDILDENDRNILIKNLSITKKEINYVLTNHEIVLIRALLRSYFRALLSPKVSNL